MKRSARLTLVGMSLVTLFGATSPVVAQDAPAPHTVAARRPPALVPLYASFTALQLIDLHSTWRAMDQGGVEANPLLGGFATNKPAMLSVKAAGTAGVIAASEALRKKSRAAAIIFMIGANSAMTWVVQHNYRAVP